MDAMNTKQAAKRLGLNVSTLSKAVWAERFTPPAKGPGGAYYWTEADLERASWVLRGCALEDVHQQQVQAAQNGEEVHP